MGKKLSDRKKSEVIDLYLKGFSRDEIARRTCVSAGAVSGIIREFSDSAESKSLDQASEEYGVAETVEDLRSLALEIRRSKTNVEELLRLSGLLERIRRLVPLERLEAFVGAGESLKDRSHVEASIRMQEIEERLGKTHDEILRDLEAKEAKARELGSEIQRLESCLEELDGELKDRLERHSLTLEKIERFSKIEEDLGKRGLGLERLEDLSKVLQAVEEEGFDAKKLVQLAKETGSLKARAEAETKALEEARDLAGKLHEALSELEGRLSRAELIVERCLELESMGWSLEGLDRAIGLAKACGSPEEALQRLELLKPSIEAREELSRLRAEAEDLRGNAIKAIKEASENLSRLAEDSLSLVKEGLPGLVAEASNIMKAQIGSLAVEYNRLVERHGELQGELNRLKMDYEEHRRALDEAISWTTLLKEPEKLPGDKIRRVLLETLLPRLQTWCRSRQKSEVMEFAGELAKGAICLYATPAESFFRDPGKAEATDAAIALISFTAVSIPFYYAFTTWYNLHESELEALKLYNAHHHLQGLFEEVRKLRL